MGRTCCPTAALKGTVQAQFGTDSRYLKKLKNEKNKKTKNKTRIKENLYDQILRCLNLFTHFSSPKEPFHFKVPYVKCVFSFITWLHTLAKDVSETTWTCVRPRRFFIVPASTLQPAACAVIHVNAIIFKKQTIKKKKKKYPEFKENGVKKKLIKTGVIYMDNCANDC